MELVLVRHGIAIDREHPACPADPERPLTTRGKQRTYEAMTGLARLLELPHQACDPSLEQLWVSPYLRARQTAAIAKEVLGLQAVMETISQALVPEGDPAEVGAAIAARGGARVWLFGHAPSLDAIIAAAVGAPAPVTALKKCGVAFVSLDSGRFGGGVLTALYPARALRLLAERAQK